MVLARSTGVDVVTGTGLDAALSGVAAVVDASSTPATSRRAAERFFRAATTTLLAAAERAGVGHHVVVSVVGSDRVPLGHYHGKRVQESLALAAAERGRTGVSVLRATQFHEFAAQFLAGSAVAGRAFVPDLTYQPVAAAEVGAALADLAAGPPRGQVRPLAGPRPDSLADVARRYLARRAAAGSGPGLRIVPVPVPGPLRRALHTDALLPAPGARLGTATVDAWLATVAS